MHSRYSLDSQQHKLEPSPFVWHGEPRTNDCIGGSTQSEHLFFRYLDLITYLQTRHGHIEMHEIADALPGWSGSSAAIEQQRHRMFTALRAHLGMQIDTVSDLGEAGKYQVTRHVGNTLLRYAKGTGCCPDHLEELPDYNWSTLNAIHAACAVLRTLALSSRRSELVTEDLEPSWPLNFLHMEQFVNRCYHRDLSANQHHAVRFLWIDTPNAPGSRFRLSSLWPTALLQQRSA